MPIRFTSAVLFAGLLASAGGLAACAGGESAAAAPAGPPQVVATVGDHAISLDEVDARAFQADTTDYRGLKLGQALFEARRSAIDDLVAAYLLDREATGRGISRDALVESEVTRKLTAVQDADVEAWYRENAARVGNAALDDVRTPIRTLLAEQRKQEALTAFIDGLKASTPVRVTLEPPRSTIEVAEHDATVGPADAPIQVIEYSDFQ